MKACPFCAEEIQDAAVVCKHCGKAVVAPRPAVRNHNVPLPIALTLVALAVFGAYRYYQYVLENGPVVQFSQSLTSAPSRTAGVTLAQFLQLQDGMTYAEARGILGRPGVEQSRGTIAGVTTVLYGWGGTSMGANMNAMFQDDRLVTKAQFGLE